MLMLVCLSNRVRFDKNYSICDSWKAFDCEAAARMLSLITAAEQIILTLNTENGSKSQ